MTFEKLLLESIDESLAYLGKQAKQAVYFHLKNTYALSEDNIPYRIEDFTEAIEDIFQAGAKMLEIKIMEILFAKMGQGYVSIDEPESWEFINYVYALRNRGLCFSLSPPLYRPQKKCDL